MLQGIVCADGHAKGNCVLLQGWRGCCFVQYFSRSAQSTLARVQPELNQNKFQFDISAMGMSRVYRLWPLVSAVWQYDNKGRFLCFWMVELCCYAVTALRAFCSTYCAVEQSCVSQHDMWSGSKLVKFGRKASNENICHLLCIIIIYNLLTWGLRQYILSFCQFPPVSNLTLSAPEWQQRQKEERLKFWGNQTLPLKWCMLHCATWAEGTANKIKRVHQTCITQS